MTLTAQQVLELWQEPPEVFAQRLTIESLKNEYQTLSPLLFEQVRYAEALAKYKRVIALKPRAVGFTTLSTLFMFAKTYRALNPRLVLQTVHDDAALKRVRRMVEVAYENLPSAIRFGLRTDNREQTEFMHNRAGFRRLVAGVRGQGRSYSFTDYHATEMAFYPQGSSAHKSSDTSADDDLFSSVQAAMNDETGHIIVESTGNGPRGLFHRLVQKAHAGQEGVGFVFLPWNQVPRYRMAPPERWERTIEEEDLAKTYGLDDAQLAWRRHRIEVMGYTPLRFRREYPLTWLDPFLLDESVWFDQDAVNLMAQFARLSDVQVDGSVTRFLEPEEGRQYLIAVDTSGGVGRDEAVAQVLRDDHEHAAVWASNRTPPDMQIDVVADLAYTYNNALVIVEENKYGKQVLEGLERRGVRLWTSPETGRWWYGTGQSGGDTKRIMMTHARRVVREGIASARDPKTVAQLQLMVEDSRGRIQGRGDEHDDRAFAWCLGLWGLQSVPGSYFGPRESPEAARIRLQQEALDEFNRRYGGPPTRSR